MLGASQASADIIAEYSFPNGANPADSEHTSNFIASSVTAAGGLSISGVSGATFAATNATSGNSDGTNNLANAIANTEFYSFTLEAPAGVTAENIEISYDWVITDNDGLTTVNYSTFLLTSETGFADGNEIASAFNDDLNNPGNFLFPSDVNTDASTIAGSQNVSGSLGSGFALSSGDELEVRIYINDNSTSGGRFHRIDNILVTADLTTAVPEPAAGLILAGLFGMTLIQRRRSL